MQVGGPPHSAPPPPPAEGVVAPLQLVFEHPLPPPQVLVIDRVRNLMLRHVFELHDIGPTGEAIHRLAVATYIPNIELRPSEDPQTLVIAFTLRSRDAKQILIWTSSLFFQYVHYHVARIALLNGRPLQMDWEATQDPEAPARIKRWVETGQSIIERLHLNQ